MTDNLVSVIMPCRQAAAYLGAALDSVLAQTYGRWELIAAYDNSTDSTLAILEDYGRRDARIRVLDVSPGGLAGRNVGRARNLALREARGRYAAFLDADDLWSPRKLEVQLKYMREGSLALCATQIDTINLAGGPVGGYYPAVPYADFDFLLKENVASLSSMMADRRKCPDLRFSPTPMAEDYYCWMEQAQRGLKVHVLPEVHAFYRIRPANLWRKLSSAYWRMYINRRLLGLGWLKIAAILAPYAARTLLKNWRCHVRAARRA